MHVITISKIGHGSERQQRGYMGRFGRRKGRRNDVIIISRNKNNKIKPTRWKESNGLILKKKDLAVGDADIITDFYLALFLYLKQNSSLYIFLSMKIISTYFS